MVIYFILNSLKKKLRNHVFLGISEFRKSASKRPLPSPRFISNILVADSDKPEKEKTLALAQWTQFIGNDMFHTAVNKMCKYFLDFFMTF